MGEPELGELIQRVAELILQSTRLVVFTGAGISTESGIPDFRSPGGIWDRFDPNEFTYQRFIADPDSRRQHWKMLHDGFLARDAEPNLAHNAIADLDRIGKLDCVITQNVDNLHQRAGVPASKVYELHGNMQWAICLSCRRRYPLEQVKLRLEQGEETPDCESCHGILKPDAVLFGEDLPVDVLYEAMRRSTGCDLMLVIGSTLVVYPAAYMPEYAVSSGAKLAIINLSSTPMDYRATVVIRSKAGEVMPGIVQLVREGLKAA